MSLRVEWTDRARKDLARIDQKTRQRIAAGVETFASTGRGDVRRLQGKMGALYRLRVGEWRVIFSRERLLILLVLRVKARGGAYQ